MQWTCEQVEARLSEHLDGQLTPAETRALAVHVESCAKCEALVTEMESLVASMQRMEQAPEPATLVPAILDATLGPRRAPRWLVAVNNWLRPVFAPRLVMGFATTAVLIMLTAQATGFSFGSLRRIEWSDLHPANLYKQSNRQVHLMYARSVKYVNDLRVVSEIQSRLQASSEREPQAQPEDSSKPPAKPEDRDREEKRRRESNQLDRRNNNLTVLTSALGMMTGGVTQ